MGKDSIILVLVLICVVLFYRGKPVYVTAPVENQIDDSTWVYQARLNSKDSIIAAIKKQNKVLANDISKKDGVIVSYTELNTKLKKDLDSLSSKTFDNVDSDTTLNSKHFFADSTYLVDSKIIIKNKSINNTILFSQIKPVKINILTAIVNNKVEVSVDSKLFEVNYVAQTELKQKKDNTVTLVLIGVIGGVILGAFL